MPLGERAVTVDYLAKEGRVEPNPFLQKKEADRAYKAQQNMEESKENFSFYTSGQKNREISYSYALSQLYSNMQYFIDNVQESKDASESETKTKSLLRMSAAQQKKLIQDIYPQVLASEYPASHATFSKYKIDVKTPGEPKKLELNEEQFAALKKLSKDIHELADLSEIYYTKSKDEHEKLESHGIYDRDQKKLDARQLNTVIPNLEKLSTTLIQKNDGKIIRQDNSEIMETLRRSIGKYLIRDDRNAAINIDRQKAEQDIANRLSPYGMQLVVRKVKKQTPEEELITQTKTSVLRAAWDGYIAQPKSPRACSETLKELINMRGKEEFNKLPTTDAEKYDLSQSKVWEVCQEMPVFKEIEGELQKALSQIHFPTEKLNDLTYQDVAWLVNAYHTPDAQEVKERQENGLSDINGFMLKSSGKKNYYKSFVKKHEQDLRALLAKQDYDKEFINDAVKKMKAGKTVTDKDGNELFNAHHNFPINDPNYFEQTHPKLNWTDMNGYDNIVTMDKDVHKSLHSTENNVTGNGYISEDAGESNRTIFTDSKTGEQFYYLIQVDDGIKALTGFNNEIIYDKDYLQSHIFENGVIVSMDASSREIRKAEQEQAEKMSEYQKALQHAKERKADLENRKSDGFKSVKPDVYEKSAEKNPKKERGMGRPNYKGLGNHGAASPLSSRRGRSK
ncbi:MAG: hypothetical protein MSS98_02585 [Alphaproteobacteria bacterium]|nr:hypothetical protein [Alphaproteobacteria bacterium]MDY4689500.1 hypothetical protein [Alphaproteobacteria bacterium]